MEIIRQETYGTTKWKGGITRQIFISPADGDLAARRFDLRLSSAVIDDTASDFSDFTGFTRYILPLEGEIVLFKADRRIVLSHNALHRFEGDERVRSENTQGAVDFNIIVRHGIAVEAGVVEEQRFTDIRPTLVFALEDSSIDGKPLRRHDTAMLDSPFLFKGKAVVVRLGR